MASKKLESSEGIPKGFYRMKNTIDMKGLKSVSPKIEKKEIKPKSKLKPSYPQYA